MQALSATLGGTQSLHTNGYDEALSLPTAEAATLALRTQQIIAHESGIANTVDPLAGSYYVESLTNELEARAVALMQRVEDLGGSAKAIEQRFFQDEIARSAYEFQQRVEGGETVIVGVNRFTDDSEGLSVPSPDYAGMEKGQVARLARARASRDAGERAAALTALGEAAGRVKQGNGAALMPLVIDAVRARSSVGEISDTLVAEWGKYLPSA
jgi:methylmalonyl-CoA mutase N-terminal domain/subunit